MINPMIALATRAPDVGGVLQQNQARQNLKAREDLMRQEEEQRRENFNTAQMDKREADRLRSIATGAAELMPYVQRGDHEGAARVVEDRLNRLRDEGRPNQDTMEARDALLEGRFEDFDNMVSSAYQTGMLTGMLDVPGSDRSAGQRERADLLRDLRSDDKQTRESAEVALGLRPRAGISAQERIAMSEELAERVATSQAMIKEATTRATEVVKAEVARELSQRSQENRIEDAEAIYSRLSGADLSMIYGRGESLYPDLLRSQEGIDLMADRDQLVAMLQLGARGELKGQGPITEGEQAILSRAMTVLENPDVSPERAKQALDDAIQTLRVGVGQKTQTDAPYQEGQTATNANGDTIIFRNGEWQPL